MMANPWIAALVALVLWWASTGVILMRVRQADNAGPHGADQHLWSVFLGLPLLLGGFLGVQYSLTGASVQAAYAGFVSALAIWGWVELSFLSGIITGPNQSPCPPAVREPERFVREIGTIAWH
jgi:putative photosynthetic complex assembly protein 2